MLDVDDVQRAVVQTDSLVGSLADLRPEPWSDPIRHFVGRWLPTGAEVVLKVGLDESERAWTEALWEERTGLVPELFASGPKLAGADVEWIVHEKMPWTLSHRWPDGADIDMLIDTGVRFELAAHKIDLPVAWSFSEPRMRQSIESAIAAGAPGIATTLLDSLGDDWAWLLSTCGEDVIFGDLITPNVVVRDGPPVVSPGYLIDVIAIRGPWPFAVAWPEGKSGRGHYRGLIPKTALVRHEYGLALPADDEIARASALVMGWSMLTDHFARPRDRQNSPPDEAIKEYLSAAADAASR